MGSWFTEHLLERGGADETRLNVTKYSKYAVHISIIEATFFNGGFLFH